MRLWHKDLISVLPRQQLLAQWRELNSIYVKEDKHILINFIYDEDSKYSLYGYSLLVIQEMKRRGYSISSNTNFRFTTYFIEFSQLKSVKHELIFPNKMNKRYLKQCYYNLQEKYDCGGITNDEWELIKSKYICLGE